MPLNSVLATFREQSWNFTEVPGRENVIESAFEAHHTRVPLHVQAFPELNAVSVVSRSGVPVEAAHLPALCELVLRANQALTVGNFEIDFDHGHTVLYRATNLFPLSSPPDNGIIAGLVHSAVAEIDRLTPSLSIVAQTPPDELPTLDLRALLAREDLLPPTPDKDTP
ncbi:hypothetical protein BH23VER1_BH23VER1_09580 [soil metagenome]